MEFKLSNKRTLKIHQDTHGCNPRTDDNLGQIVSWSSKYNLGEENLNPRDYKSLQDVQNKNLTKNDIYLPVYMMDHSGISIRTTPYQCRFDSSQVGIIKVSKEKIRQEYGCKKVTKKILEIVNRVLQAEIETYNQYLTGDIYSFTVEDEDGEVLDSCAGFFGSDIKTNGILENISIEDKERVLHQL